MPIRHAAVPVLVAGLLAAPLLVLALSPVPPARPGNCFEISGRVTEVTSPCCQDIVLRMAGDPHTYYINRGMDRGFDPRELSTRLIGREARLSVIRRGWSPLDPFHAMAPVARVALGDDVLFSTFD